MPGDAALLPWIALIIGCGGPSEPLFVIAPSPLSENQEVVRFAAIGDTGVGNAGQRQVARAVGEVCAERGCDFVLLLGDNYYPRGMQAPDDPRIDELITGVYGDLGLPVYAVLGNHDWGHGRDHAAAAWQVAWAREHAFVHMPERYYRFSAGPATFFALDTTSVFFGSGADQAAWLAQDLPNTQTPWRVVFGHHPLRSNGEHGNAGAYEGLSWVPVVRGRPLADLLNTHVCGKADLYLSGHDHLLQWIRHCDTELIVSGAGAAHTELVDRGNTPRFAAARLGLAWVELGAQGTVAFYDEQGKSLYEGRIPR